MPLASGAEWAHRSPGWVFLLVSRGVAYWLHPRLKQELVAGSALLISEHAFGVVRASQLNEVEIQFFRVNPNRLSGLMNYGEQQLLEQAARQEPSAVRFFAPAAPAAQKFKEVSLQPYLKVLPLRIKLLDLFFEGLGEQLWLAPAISEETTDAKARLLKLLNELPSPELLEMSFGELARRVRCTPRHLSRIFRQAVGMSFRQKQSQLRLVRAQELLSTTESKVVEVALESGYQSLSLFNLMFKRRFGLTPAKWRDQTKL